MSWIYVGLLAGSLVTSTHDSKEACEGRGAALKEKGVVGACMAQPQQFSLTTPGTYCNLVYSDGRAACK